MRKFEELVTKKPTFYPAKKLIDLVENKLIDDACELLEEIINFDNDEYRDEIFKELRSRRSTGVHTKLFTTIAKHKPSLIKDVASKTSLFPISALIENKDYDLVDKIIEEGNFGGSIITLDLMSTEKGKEVIKTIADKGYETHISILLDGWEEEECLRYVQELLLISNNFLDLNYLMRFPQLKEITLDMITNQIAQNILMASELTEDFCARNGFFAYYDYLIENKILPENTSFYVENSILENSIVTPERLKKLTAMKYLLPSTYVKVLIEEKEFDVFVEQVMMGAKITEQMWKDFFLSAPEDVVFNLIEKKELNVTAQKLLTAPRYGKYFSKLGECWTISKEVATSARKQRENLAASANKTIKVEFCLEEEVEDVCKEHYQKGGKLISCNPSKNSNKFMLVFEVLQFQL